jgi:hypothetical protein
MSSWEATGKSDEWYTPAYIFDALGCTFDLDVAAPFEGPLHAPCDGWLYDRSLEREWTGFIWMNPPFGGRNSLEPWLAKFFAHGNGIALTPDRTSAPWWQDAAERADAHLLTRGKVRFLRPDGSEGKSPGCGTTLFAAGPSAVSALMRAASAGLGFMAMRLTATQLAEAAE